MKFVKGDGNCFPRAIAEVMGGISHTDIRLFLVSEVKSNPALYRCFENDVSEWVNTMEKDGTWVDGLAVKATANCLNVPVVVFRKNNPDQPPTAFLPEIIDDTPDLDPICVELDEAFEGCEHYSPLVPKCGNSQRLATVVDVAAPLRKRLTGKQSPTKTVVDSANIDVGGIPKKSQKQGKPLRRLKRMAKDDDKIDLALDNVPTINQLNSASIPKINCAWKWGDLAKRHHVEVVPPSGDVAAKSVHEPDPFFEDCSIDVGNCPWVYPWVYLWECPWIYSWVYPCVYPWVSPWVYPWVYPCVYPCVYPWVYPIVLGDACSCGSCQECA